MSYLAYSNKTLVQNWYEDRLAPSQPSKQYPSELVTRQKEESISCLTAAGVPKPLSIWRRQQKWDTTGVVPDDGFREMYTIHKTEMPDPGQTREEVSRPPGHLDEAGRPQAVLQKANITSLTHVE
jgi:hypothetical protein